MAYRFTPEIFSRTAQVSTRTPVPKDSRFDTSANAIRNVRANGLGDAEQKRATETEAQKGATVDARNILNEIKTELFPEDKEKDEDRDPASIVNPQGDHEEADKHRVLLEHYSTTLVEHIETLFRDAFPNENETRKNETGELLATPTNDGPPLGATEDQPAPVQTFTSEQIDLKNEKDELLEMAQTLQDRCMQELRVLQNTEKTVESRPETVQTLDATLRDTAHADAKNHKEITDALNTAYAVLTGEFGRSDLSLEIIKKAITTLDRTIILDATKKEITRPIFRYACQLKGELQKFQRDFSAYQNSLSEKNVYAGKIPTVEAALTCLDEMTKEDTSSDLVKKKVSAFLKNRKTKLAEKNGTTLVEDPRSVLGQKKISKLPHHIAAFFAQKNALKEAVSKIMKDGANAFVPLETKDFTEEMLMMAVLKAVQKEQKTTRETQQKQAENRALASSSPALQPSPEKSDSPEKKETHPPSFAPYSLKERFEAAHNKALNERAWGKITHTFTLYSEQGPPSQTITSTISPIGTMTEAHKAIGAGSSLSQQHFTQEYAEQKGRNCHDSTTYTTAKNFAVTEIAITPQNGQTETFVAGRHGVLSAYGITKKHFEHLPKQDAQDMLRTLLFQGKEGLSLNEENQKALKKLFMKNPQYIQALFEGKTSSDPLVLAFSKKLAAKYNKATLDDGPKDETFKAFKATTDHAFFENTLGHFRSSLFSKKLNRAQKEAFVETLFETLKEDTSSVFANTISSSLLAKGLVGNRLTALMRHQANINRAKEVLTGLAAANAKALLERQKNGEQIRFQSISLLTPDVMRHAIGSGSSSDEKRMLKEQLAALAALEAECKKGSFKIFLNDPTQDAPVELNLKNVVFLSCNFGVNAGAVTKYGRATSLSGWDYANKTNNQMIGKLFGENRAIYQTIRKGTHDGKDKIGTDIAYGGEIGKELTYLSTRLTAINNEINALSERGAGTALTEKTDLEAQKLKIEDKIKMIKYLAKDIAEMARSTDYRKEGESAYKMVRALAALSMVMGNLTAWNCKSGKDRTGALDAEVKFMLSHWKENGTFPNWREELSEESKIRMTDFYLNGGNFEMQGYNTGFCGYKLKGVNSLFKQFTNKNIKKIFLGTSDFVSS